MLAPDMRTHTLGIQIDLIADELRKFEIPSQSKITVLALCDVARANVDSLHASLDPISAVETTPRYSSVRNSERKAPPIQPVRDGSNVVWLDRRRLSSLER